VPRHRLSAVPVLLALLVGAAPARAQMRLPQGFADQRVLAGLDRSIAIAFLPDGRLFYLEEHSAQVRLIVKGAIASIDPVGTIAGLNTTDDERGLLGIAVDPQWPMRPYIYLYVSDAGPYSRISRYALIGDLMGTAGGALTIDPTSRLDLLTDIPDNTPEHNGGTVRFGPDGMLYVGSGNDWDNCGSQDLTSLLGKILRLDVSRLPARGGVTITKSTITPADNPFASNPDPDARLVWAYGLRNPFRFHVDPRSGDLFISDVGENSWEEIDRTHGGGVNLGWPVLEGTHPFTTSCSGAAAGQAPIYNYDHNTGLATIDVGPYRAPVGATHPFPSIYEGDEFFSDYFGGFIRRLKFDGATWQIAPAAGQPSQLNWAEGIKNPTDFAIAPDGSIWYCSFDHGYATGSGEIHRIVYGAAPDTGGGPPLPSDTTHIFQPATFDPPFPTPAVNGVMLSYALVAPAPVKLTISDLAGRMVRTLVSYEFQDTGPHQILWDRLDKYGHRVPAGLLFARLEVEGRVYNRHIVLVR